MSSKSERIKEAGEAVIRAAETVHRQNIFRNFADATAALLDCPVTPEDVREEVLKMVEGLGDEHDGDDACDGDLARKVLTRVFGLEEDDGDDGLEAAALGLADEEEAEEAKAALELANAFATIVEYCDYLPPGFYRTIDDWMSDFFAKADWTNHPALIRRVGPHILRAAIENEGEGA